MDEKYPKPISAGVPNADLPIDNEIEIPSIDEEFEVPIGEMDIGLQPDAG